MQIVIPHVRFGCVLARKEGIEPLPECCFVQAGNGKEMSSVDVLNKKKRIRAGHQGSVVSHRKHRKYWIAKETSRNLPILDNPQRQAHDHHNA